MAYLKERFGVKEVAFYDDSFTLDKKRVHAIAEKIIEYRTEDSLDLRDQGQPGG